MSHTLALDSLPAPLRDLVARIAREGGEITVVDGDRTVARVVPPPTRRLSGEDAGKVWMSPDFDDPLPDLERLMYGDDD